jgi:hypothetical protein
MNDSDDWGVEPEETHNEEAKPEQPEEKKEEEKGGRGGRGGRSLDPEPEKKEDNKETVVDEAYIADKKGGSQSKKKL